MVICTNYLVDSTSVKPTIDSATLLSSSDIRRAAVVRSLCAVDKIKTCTITNKIETDDMFVFRKIIQNIYIYIDKDIYMYIRKAKMCEWLTEHKGRFEE